MLPSVTGVQSGIFSDASIITSERFDSTQLSQPSTDRLLLEDGIVLSPTEAQMFKKVQRIVLENKDLKNALVDNSQRLQEHVNDCIQWKEHHKNVQDQLQRELNKEREKCSQLQNCLDSYAASTQSSGFGGSSGGQQIPLMQHLQMKQQLDDVNRENQEVKVQLERRSANCTEKEERIGQLLREKDEVEITILEKNSVITNLMSRIEDLENNARSVDILDLVPQQQPKEVKQLEKNLEGYKRTIDRLKERNEELENDLSETTETFDRIEEENSQLREKIQKLEAMASETNRGSSSSADSTRIGELESALKAATDELNTLREKQLVTYELSDSNGSGSVDQMNAEELKINNLNEELNAKTHVCEKMTEQISTVEEALHLKEIEVEKLNSQLKELHMKFQENIALVKDYQLQLKVQKDTFDTKNRLHIKRESKDADQINELLTKNDQLTKEVESLKKDIVDLQQHMEQLLNHVDKQPASIDNKDLAFLCERSKDLMSIDYEVVMKDVAAMSLNDQDGEDQQPTPAQMEYVNQVRAENETLLEECEQLKTRVQNLQEEEARFLVVEQENEATKQQLQEIIEDNNRLRHLNASFEEQFSDKRLEVEALQQQYHDSMNTNKELNNRLQVVEHAHEKQKKDAQQTYNSMQTKVMKAKAMEEKVNDLTSELVGAKELINDLQEKAGAAGSVIADLREKEKMSSMQSRQMREQMDEVEVLRMQLDVYKNDFDSERESREKTQAMLEEERTKLAQLQLENQRVNEELRKKTNQQVNMLQQRHGRPNAGGGGLQTAYNAPPTSMYGAQGMDQAQIWQQQQQLQHYQAQRQQQLQQQQQQQQHVQPQQQQPQQQQGAGNWQVSGRGHGGHRMEEDEQRKCPRCQAVLPDLDSLQIHVMECLDK